jgi:hypothetical protein
MPSCQFACGEEIQNRDGIANITVRQGAAILNEPE